jgi:hypothetical protein
MNLTAKYLRWLVAIGAAVPSLCWWSANTRKNFPSGSNFTTGADSRNRPRRGPD